MMKPVSPHTVTQRVTWFSRILRWGLGLVFAVAGLRYWDSGGWPAVLFGAAFFITGFFRPKRCVADPCALPDTD